MEKTGSKDDLLDAYGRDGSKSVLKKTLNKQSATLKDYEKTLSRLTSHLREAASIGDAELSLQLERLSIRIDYQNHMIDRKRVEKDLSQSIAAEKSLEFLKTDPQGYRKKISEVFPDGIKNLPEGDAYITHAKSQIKNLGQAKSWMSTPVETAYLEARQDNLKTGIKAYQELQGNALFPPPPEQNKKQGSA